MGVNGYGKRLDRVALSLGACPTHAERLLCPVCDFTEDALPAAADRELTGYLERLTPHTFHKFVLIFGAAW
jgi:hypothetical protein